MSECIFVRVTGWVQGVGYRAYARREAQRLGLSGWVRNVRDGSVEAEAQGNREQLQRFLEALKRGPAGSRVREVEVEPREASPARTGFQVRWEE